MAKGFDIHVAPYCENCKEFVPECRSDTYGNQRAKDTYHFDSATGEITSVERYADKASDSKTKGWVYSVHVGSWGGMFTRVLWFLAAMLGATLPLTGYYLWIKRKFFKKRSQ